MKNVTKLIAQVEDLLSQLKAVSQPVVESKSGVSKATDRVLKRNARIAAGFAKRGIKLTFDKDSGRFNNVKPYNTWLAEGFQVQKHEKSVEGFFHVSQVKPVAKAA